MDNSYKKKKKGRIKRGLGLFLSAAMVCNTLLFDVSTVFAEEMIEESGKEAAAPDETAKDEAAQEEAVQEESAKDEAVQDETIIKEETAQEGTTKGDTAEEDTTKEEQTEGEKTQEEIIHGEVVEEKTGSPDEIGEMDAGEAAEEMQDNVSAEDTGLCTHHKEHTAECGYSSPSEEDAGSPCTYVCRICPIEELIAALPEADDVSGDNAEEVQAQLEKILALYTELTEEEQEQTDISRCLALQEALELLAGQGRAKTPALIADAVSYLDYDADGKELVAKNCEAYAEISSDTTTWTESNDFNGWYVANGSVTISERVTVTGNVHLILMNGCTLNAAVGITVNSGNSLTIYAQPVEGGDCPRTQIATD